MPNEARHLLANMDKFESRVWQSIFKDISWSSSYINRLINIINNRKYHELTENTFNQQKMMLITVLSHELTDEGN